MWMEKRTLATMSLNIFPFQANIKHVNWINTLQKEVFFGIINKLKKW